MPEVQSTIEYRDVPGFPGYRAGSDGSIWSCYVVGGRGKKGDWRAMSLPITHGYQRVILCRAGVRRYITVHQIVLLSFFGPCPSGQQVRHLDGCRTNNAYSNLCYGTAKENAADRQSHGRTARGSDGGMAKLDEDAILSIRQRVAEGATLVEQAETHKVSAVMVGKIVRGEAWQHVGGPLTQIGVARGERSGTATTSEVTARRVLELAATGVRQAEICRQLKLGRSKVGHIVRRNRWKHLETHTETSLPSNSE